MEKEQLGQLNCLGLEAVGGTKYGNALAVVKSNPWKKAVMRDPDCKESPWDAEEWFDNSGDVPSAWKAKEALVAATSRGSVLDSENASSSYKATSPKEDLGNQFLRLKLEIQLCQLDEMSDDVVDDWEKTYD